jgi:molybdopterin-guanine dinucleotide biosynthesis protein A
LKGGLVLAGGKSTRFGGNKALVRLGEKSLITHVVDVALRVADEVVVAIGRESSSVVYRKLLPESVTLVKDRLRAKSPLVGILSGLQVMKSGYSIVLSCDTPFASGDVLKLLFKRAVRSDSAIPQWPNGDLEPLQSVYKVRPTISAAKDALRCGEFGSVDMIRRLRKVTYVPVEEIRSIDKGLTTFFNINRRSDLRRAERFSSLTKTRGKAKTISV